MKKSRYVKVDVRNAIDKRDRFKCVWCGTKQKERHHNVEFHLGGEHSIENLTLLCPNCHTLIHAGAIDPVELHIRRENQTNPIV